MYTHKYIHNYIWMYHIYMWYLYMYFTLTSIYTHCSIYYKLLSKVISHQPCEDILVLV